jgi:hypothetical protein
MEHGGVWGRRLVELRGFSFRVGSGCYLVHPTNEKLEVRNWD